VERNHGPRRRRRGERGEVVLSGVWERQEGEGGGETRSDRVETGGGGLREVEEGVVTSWGVESMWRGDARR